jgi:hypothetical protein
MTITPDSLRADLAALAGDKAKTDAADGHIRETARARLEVVQARIDELKPKAMTDDAAGEEYQMLIAERGRLNLIQAGR